MLTWFKRFLWDETAFVGVLRYLRALLVSYGAAASAGALPTGIPGGQRYAWIFIVLGMTLNTQAPKANGGT